MTVQVTVAFRHGNALVDLYGALFSLLLQFGNGDFAFLVIVYRFLLNHFVGQHIHNDHWLLHQHRLRRCIHPRSRYAVAQPDEQRVEPHPPRQWPASTCASKPAS